VDCAEAIGYCKKRYVQLYNNCVYLLTKKQFNGYHAELMTYYIYNRLQAGEQKPTSCAIGYKDSCSESKPPCIKIESAEAGLAFKIIFNGSLFEIHASGAGLLNDVKIASLIEKYQFEKLDNDGLQLKVPLPEIEAKIVDMYGFVSGDNR
jgi:hypothetical protein